MVTLFLFLIYIRRIGGWNMHKCDYHSSSGGQVQSVPVQRCQGTNSTVISRLGPRVGGVLIQGFFGLCCSLISNGFKSPFLNMCWCVNAVVGNTCIVYRLMHMTPFDCVLLSLTRLHLSKHLLPSPFRFKGFPPEDATGVCGCGFCQPARQQHSHGGWVKAVQPPWAGWDNACCSVTWEGETYRQSPQPHRTGDLWLWPIGFVFVVVCVSTTDTHTFKVMWQSCLISHPLFWSGLSLSFSFRLCGITSFHRASELHPLPALPVLQKQDYLPP